MTLARRALFFLAPDSPTAAQGEPELSPEQAKRASAIAKQTMSPFCPGRTLADCPSEYAGEWRKEIRGWVAEGRSAPDIKDELERRAGANLSGSPNRDASYLVPVGIALGGFGILALLFVRLRRSKEPDAAPKDAPGEPDGEAPSVDDTRLEQELRAESDGRDE